MESIKAPVVTGKEYGLFIKNALKDKRPNYNSLEFDAMNKVLSAAALTYVAAFLSALAQFAHYAFLLLGQRREEE